MYICSYIHTEKKKKIHGPHIFREPEMGIPLADSFQEKNIVQNDSLKNQAIMIKKKKEEQDINDIKTLEKISKIMDEINEAKKNEQNLENLENTLEKQLYSIRDYRNVKEDHPLYNILCKMDIKNNQRPYEDIYSTQIQENNDNLINEAYRDIGKKDIPTDKLPYIGYVPNTYIPEDIDEYIKKEKKNKLLSKLNEYKEIYNTIKNDSKNISIQHIDDIVGDPGLAMIRMLMNRNTQEALNIDKELTNLQRGTRTSPIYNRITKYEERLPRPPLPSDGRTHITSTLGLLHMYRLHHAKMFLRQHRRKKAMDLIVGRNYVDIDTLDLQLDKDILRDEYENFQNFINRIREEFKVSKGAFGYQQKADILLYLKKYIHKFSTREQKHIQVQLRRRR